MKEPYREGVATTLAPSHAPWARKGHGEALTRGSAGQVLSPEMRESRVPTPSHKAEGNSRQADRREDCPPVGVGDPVHARTLFTRKSRDPLTGHDRDGLVVRCGNPQGARRR